MSDLQSAGTPDKALSRFTQNAPVRAGREEASANRTLSPREAAATGGEGRYRRETSTKRRQPCLLFGGCTLIADFCGEICFTLVWVIFLWWR